MGSEDFKTKKALPARWVVINLSENAKRVLLKQKRTSMASAVHVARYLFFVNPANHNTDASLPAFLAVFARILFSWAFAGISTPGYIFANGIVVFIGARIGRAARITPTLFMVVVMVMVMVVVMCKVMVV